MLITVIQDEVHVYRYNKDKTLCWLSKKVHLHTTEEALWFITCVGKLTFDAPVHARLSKFYFCDNVVLYFAIFLPSVSLAWQ